jgi:GNAT superfamily N-acetyltransferase
MALQIYVREAVPADGPAIAELFNHNPDAGRIAIAAHYHLDPLQLSTILATNTITAVAQDRRSGDILGVGMINLADARQVDGQLHRTAVLNSLIVDPNHRGQGIGKALVNWRMAAIRTKLGDGALIVARIQQHNEASMAVARTWCRAIAEPLQTCMVATLKKPPKHISNLSFRWAEPTDLEEIVTRLNDFYRDYNLFSPQTAESLAEWLQKSPLDQPIRRYMVVTDSHNNLLAGLGVTEQYRFMQMKVTRLPLIMRMLNQVIGMVPADGYLKQNTVNYFWFDSNQPDAARLLWQEARWRVQAHGTHLTFSYDPRGLFPHIIRLPKWMPKGAFVLALSQSIDKSHLLYPP